MHRFWKSFQGRQTKKKDLATHFPKTLAMKTLNRSGAPSDTAAEGESAEDQAELSCISAVRRVLGDRIHLTTATTKFYQAYS